MSTQLVIYLASIAGAVKFWFGMVAFVIALGNLIFAFARTHPGEWNVPAEKFLWKIHLPVWVFAASIAFACAVIPRSDDIYKIAGVTGQQKAQIDAAGKVVSDSAQKATP